MWETFLTDLKRIYLVPCALLFVAACSSANVAQEADQHDMVLWDDVEYVDLYDDWNWQEFISFDELTIMFQLPQTHEEASKVEPAPAPVTNDSRGCPHYLTTRECDIWLTKPHFRESRKNMLSGLRAAHMNEIVNVIRADVTLTGNHSVAKPLVDRYLLLMAAANACCRDGMNHHLRRSGASQGLIYKFVMDDANFHLFGQRCLMTSDRDLDWNFTDMMLAEVMADVRNTCLCRSRAWFRGLLEPFTQLYTVMPEFAEQEFLFSYRDGLQRTVTVSINRDVQNVLFLLGACP